MIQNKKLLVVAIITNLLLVLIAIYFKCFPTIISSQISNIFIFSLVFLLIFLLVYGAFLIQTKIDAFLLLPQSLFITFIARAIPNLRLSYPPLDDPYFYFGSTQNILQFGTLEPVLGWWYFGTDSMLHWPLMHLFSTFLINIPNLNSSQVFRFQEPFIGTIFFLFMFIFTREITENYGVALVSGLFASLSDIIIFYQAEYHSQGFAFFTTMLVMYAFVKSRKYTSRVGYRYLLILTIIAFCLSHYFVPLFLSILFITYLIFLLSIEIFNLFIIKKSLLKISTNIKNDHNFLLIVILFSLSYHFLVYTSFLDSLMSLMSHSEVLNAPLVSTVESRVPLFTSVLSAFKWGLFLLALVSILQVLVTKNPNEIRLSILIVCTLFAGIFGNYFIPMPLDRIIGFFILFASVFASLTLFRLRKNNFLAAKKGIFLLFVLFASLILLAGFFNSQTPAYFFKDSNIDSYYYYSNRLPSMSQYKYAGDWIGYYTPNNSIYSSKYYSYMAIFYFTDKDKLFSSETFRNIPTKKNLSHYSLINYEYASIDAKKTHSNMCDVYSEIYPLIYDSKELRLYKLT